MTSPDLDCIREIRDAAQRATVHIDDLDPETVAANVYVQDGVVRCLIVIGEAAKALSPEARAEFADIDWSELVGLRDTLLDRDREIDYHAVWRIVNRDLPPIIESFGAYLAANREPLRH